MRRRPAMEHIAIDLGARKSQICIRNPAGDVVEEKRIPTSDVGAYLRRRPSARVVVETCAESFFIAEQAKEAGHEVRIVPGTLVRTLGVGARRTKTDRRDAQVLSEVSCRIDLPSVHLPTRLSRERKAMCSMRDALVRSRTQVSNCVRGWLRTQGVRLASGSFPTFAARVRAQLPSVPPHVARQSERKRVG